MITNVANSLVTNSTSLCKLERERSIRTIIEAGKNKKCIDGYKTGLDTLVNFAKENSDNSKLSDALS